MSGDLSHVVGGFSRISAGGWALTEGWRITNIAKTAPLQATISFWLDPAGVSEAKFFLGASL